MKLIFDIDGVLVDTRLSYHHAIKQTAEFFLQRVVSIEEVNTLKQLEGMNNDWVATHSLIAKELPNISFDDVKNKFQSIYIGEGGLWEKEAPIFSVEQLQSLCDATGPLSIITGRTFEEADFVLCHFQIRDLFDTIVSVEAQPDRMDKSDVRLLEQIPQIQTFEKILYFGDNVSDLKLVQNARLLYPIQSVWFTATLGDLSRSYISNIQKMYKPDHMAKTPLDVMQLVQNI